MIPVIEGRLPLLVAADRASDIDAALRLAREFNLKIMISGGAEGWMMADKLGLAIEHFEVRTDDGFEGAFAAIAQSKCDGLLAFPDALTNFNRQKIVAFALRITSSRTGANSTPSFSTTRIRTRSTASCTTWNRLTSRERPAISS